MVALKEKISGFVLLALSLAFSTCIQAKEFGVSYAVNAGDTLRVYVWNEESLARELLVGPDGHISFPMVGDIDVNGLSTLAIGERIALGLSEYLRDKPQVTVSLMAVNGNRIFVLGTVRRPGQFIVTSPTDVMQALALAGGLDEFSSGKGIKVLRRNADGVQRAIKFDYGRVTDGRDLETNILLKANDVVVVP